MRYAWAAVVLAAVVAAGCEPRSGEGSGPAGSPAAPPGTVTEPRPAPEPTRPTARATTTSDARTPTPTAKPPAAGSGTADTDPPPAFPAPPAPARETSDAEPLPDLPRLAPDSKLTALNKEKTFFLEASADDKTRRVLFVAEVCLREGPLEVFLCKKGTKEHESVVRVDLDARLIHAALVAAGARPGHPAQYVPVPDTDKFEFRPPTGSTVKVSVHYRKDGKPHTRRGQEWLWNTAKKRPAEYEWVFAGSAEIKDPDRPNSPPFYGANSGEVISISNFPYSMLDFPAEISKDNADLTYTARTEFIPPTLSKVWVILEPVPDKK